MYRYSLRSTRASSHKYGLCEVCGKHATEVFSQGEERKYDPADRNIEDIVEDAAMYIGGVRGWTHNRCRSYYGHRECLLAQRREPWIEKPRDLPHEVRTVKRPSVTRL